MPAVSQQLTSPRGKVHRINPDGTVPTDNPFYDGTGPERRLDLGARAAQPVSRLLRPADAADYFIGDVGGNDPSTAVEEVDLGVARRELRLAEQRGPLLGRRAQSPLFSYPHNGRDAAITGGFVYHGTPVPEHATKARYFYADYTQNWIRGLKLDASGNVTGTFNFEPSDGTR